MMRVHPIPRVLSLLNSHTSGKPYLMRCSVPRLLRSMSPARIASLDAAGAQSPSSTQPGIGAPGPGPGGAVNSARNSSKRRSALQEPDAGGQPVRRLASRRESSLFRCAAVRRETQVPAKDAAEDLSATVLRPKASLVDNLGQAAPYTSFGNRKHDAKLYLGRPRVVKRAELEMAQGGVLREDKVLHEDSHVTEMLTQKQRRSVILPNSRFKTAWDALLAILVSYTAIMLPIELCYDDVQGTLTEYIIILDIFMDAIFLLDIAINFRVGYTDLTATLVIDHAAIRRKYLGRWFLIDAIGAFPGDTIMAIIAREGASSDVVATNASGLVTSGGFGQREAGILTLVKVLKIPKIMRLGRLLKSLEKLEGIASVANIVILLVIIMFLVSRMCTWPPPVTCPCLPCYQRASHLHTSPHTSYIKHFVLPVPCLACYLCPLPSAPCPVLHTSVPVRACGHCLVPTVHSLPTPPHPCLSPPPRPLT